VEGLSAKVYECTLAVEAHMVCDLLSQAGISARVDGEFLAGAGGELPLGNTVKVRVAPERAAEAREVIAEWEKLQPVDPVAAPAARTPRFRSMLWFIVGAIVGVGGAFIALRTPTSYDSVDYDGDGRADIRYQYQGRVIARVDYDRDDDGRVDESWLFDVNGFERERRTDDDFDGRFEWQGKVEEGDVVRDELDRDGDGDPERVVHMRHGVTTSVDYYAAGRVMKRERYVAGLLESAEYDDDADGTFERRVTYDSRGEPRL
jgi:hypothetical protein